MALTISLIAVAMIALAVLELSAFWALAARRPPAPTAASLK
jgi:hypothetical protein